MPRSLAVVGRFPPPLDGQAIATERLADLLEDGYSVTRHDVGAPEGDRLVTGRSGLGRALHFARMPIALRRDLEAEPNAPVLWPSISPSPLGHARDLLTVVPAFGRRPVVGVVHRGDFDRLFRSPATALTGRALVRRLRALVFLSESLANRCAEFVPDEKRWVVPNTIDAAAIPSASVLEGAQRHRAGRDGLRLLFLSGMIPSKGYGDVLEAVAVLRDRGLEVSAQFVGRWPSLEAETDFRQRVADLEVADHVEVVGGVGRDEIQGLLLGADVFVLPTFYPIEAQPLTIIEALASGTPVIITRHAGLPEMIENGREGRFVGARSPKEIADAAASFLDRDRWSASSRSARARFVAAFSPEAVGNQWRDVLSRLDALPRYASER